MSDHQQLSMVLFPQYFAEPEILLQCKGAKFAIDAETGGLRWWSDKLIGLGVYCPERNVQGFVVTDSLERKERVQKYLLQLGEDPNTKVVMHNAKFDAHFLDIPLSKQKWQLCDSMLAAHLYDSRLPKGLGKLEELLFGTTTKKQNTPMGGRGNLVDAPLDAVAQYCVNDCRLSYEVMSHFSPLLQKMGLVSLFKKDIRFLGLLQQIEKAGLPLDMEYLTRSRAILRVKLAQMEQQLYKEVGEEFNWRSGATLSRMLYDKMGIPKPVSPYADADGVDRSKFAHRGKYNSQTTSSFILMEKVNHPLGLLIMDMRETDKLAKTFDNWEELLDYRDGEPLVHSDFNQTGTRTGRLSSSRPNLQNVAADVRVRHTQSVYSGGAHREAEYNLRLAFHTPPDEIFLSIDYRQQEMRLFAILAKEPEMMEALKRREDIHKMIAQAVWAKEIEKDSSRLSVCREWSKTIGFGLIYGMTIGSLEHRLNKTKEEAQALAQQYWTRFPRIMPFLHETVDLCAKQGYVRYWSGRIWREENKEDMYKAANAQVQGGSADLLSIAAMRCAEYLEKQGCGSIVSLIHDEILFRAPKKEYKRMADDLGKIMEVEDLLGVPFVTSLKVGNSYGELLEVEQYEQKYGGVA